MARKKKSEMTPIELMDQALKGRTWDEAEAAAVEVLARCMAIRVYREGKGVEYFNDLMTRIATRADEWAHQYLIKDNKTNNNNPLKQNDNEK